MKEATIMLSIIGFQEYVQLYQNSSTGNINGVAQEYYPRSFSRMLSRKKQNRENCIKGGGRGWLSDW